MKAYSQAKQIAEIIGEAKHIALVQADNPDIDSLSSSLALESILTALGKEVSMYCGVDLPSYMRYVPGWDRVSDQLPRQFDVSIIIDTSSDGLLSQLDRSGEKAWLKAKPCIVIDHHDTEPTIGFAKVILAPKAVATGEVIYELAKQLDWPLDDVARDMITIGILSDSLGLMSGGVTARTIHIIAELVDAGVDLAQLDSARRETMRREPELIHYKGELLQRVEFHDNNRIAIVTIPWAEIEKYSPLYNPPMLVLDDMRLSKETDLAIAFKLYTDGKITAKLRANYGHPIAGELAEHFGGGGHPYAAGFKIESGKDIETLKNEVVEEARRLLDEEAKSSK